MGTPDLCDAQGADVGCNYYSGHSMIVNPIAWQVAQACGVEKVVVTKLNPDPLRYITTDGQYEQVFDHLEDCDLELYPEILREARSRFGRGRRLPRQSPGSASTGSL